MESTGERSSVTSESKIEKNQTRIIAVGASAGGLEALKAFFDTIVASKSSIGKKINFNRKA